MGEYLTFNEGLSYPWQKPMRLWYALWILVPIFGWFVLGGFGVKIIKNLVAGKNKEAPEMGDIWESFVTGVVIFLKFLPLLIVIMIIDAILITMPVIGWLLYTLFIVAMILLTPWLFINLVMTGKIEESFQIKKAWNIVYSNFREYIIVLLKSFGIGILYGLLSIVLIGIPCSMYTKYYFFCDFYRKYK